MIITQQNLFQALSKLKGAINKNAVSEYLTSVLCKVVDGNLEITGTNMDIFVKTTAEIEGDIEPFCVDFKSIFELSQKSKHDLSFSIQKDGGLSKLIVKRAKATAELPLLNVENFPVFKQIEVKKQAKFYCKTLLKAFNFVKPCIYTNETRYNINGVCLHFKQDFGLVIVSTDGNRLAKFELPYSATNFDQKITIPQKSLVAIVESLKASETVSLSFNERQALFDFDGTQITTKLIDAQFPDYERVMPKNNDDYVEFDKSELLEDKDFCEVVAKTTEPQMIFDINEESLKITFSTELAKSYSEIPCRATKPFFTKINPDYLQECLATLEKPRLYFNSQPNTPLTLKDNNEADGMYVIMPMK